MTVSNDIYSVEIIAAKNMIFVEVRGQFTTETYKQFTTEVIRATKTLASHGKKISIMTDLRKGVVQTQAIANDNDWKKELEQYVNKNANILESTIYKMQLQRSQTLVSDDIQYFETIEDAQRWIDEED